MSDSSCKLTNLIAGSSCLCCDLVYRLGAAVCVIAPRADVADVSSALHSQCKRHCTDDGVINMLSVQVSTSCRTGKPIDEHAVGPQTHA